MTTAEALHRATGAPLSFEPLLHERNFGDIRGTAYADLGFDMFEPDYAPPNGESWPVFHRRVDQAWARVRALAPATPGHLAVVTHGLVCRSLATRHLRLADGIEVPERWENTSLTIVESAAPWEVRLLNCIAHLEDLDAAPTGPTRGPSEWVGTCRSPSWRPGPVWPSRCGCCSSRSWAVSGRRRPRSSARC